MSRSKWKSPYIHSKFLSKKLNKNKIWCRSSVIPNSLVGSVVFIHRGNSFKKIFITREKVGFKFGEYSNTRLFIKHKKSVKTVSKQKK